MEATHALVDKILKLSNGKQAIPAEQVLRERSIHKKTVSDLKALMLRSALVSRTQLLSTLGKSYSGNRDLYTILGYPVTLDFANYQARYERQDIAKACVDRPVNASWRKKPEIYDDEDPKVETEFEKKLKELNKKLRWMHYLTRLDKLSSIGTYGVLFFGLSDGQTDLLQPATKANDLLYLSVFAENSAQISTWEEDVTNARYGLPKAYQIKMYNKGGDSFKQENVHHSRVLHVAPDVLESEVYGTPALKASYNRLQDLEMISGGSAEMYWRGARPGYHLTNKEDYSFDDDAKETINAELEEFENQIRRFLRIEGVDIKEMTAQMQSPREFVDVLIDLICAERNIPKRILLGSERGELASSQDRANWAETTQTRQEDHVEPVIIRPFIDRLIEYGIVPEPKNGEYIVDWPEIEEPGEEQVVDVANKAADAIAKYANANGADMVVPVEIFLERFFNFSQGEIEHIMGLIQGRIEEEDAMIEEEERIAQEEERVRLEEEKRLQQEGEK